MKRLAKNAGLTLVELVIALGLLALMMLLVIQVFDRALLTWRNAETRRAVMEASTIVTELVTADLRGIEGGPRGDFVLEWVMFDTNGDGVRESKWPRLRLLRQASRAEVARVQRDLRLAVERKATGGDGEVVRVEAASPSQLEIVWLVAPSSTSDKDSRSVGMLWRGERLVTDSSSKSFFDANFFGSSNMPPAGATQEVTGGILWMNVLLASQSTDVHDGWKHARDARSAATSWDAWTKDRPNASMHAWNERQAGVPPAKDRPVLPRRARLELEIERPIDRARRTRTLEAVDNQGTVLVVDDGQRVPLGPDVFILLDAEWMKVSSVDGKRVVVERGQRGTTPASHEKDTLVHHGLRTTTEVTIAAFREDWRM